VLWGTLLGLVALADLPGEGAAAVAARLVPHRGDSPWAWLNAFTVPLAAIVWLLVAALRLAVRRRQP
jgi:hypothetical protein